MMVTLWIVDIMSVMFLIPAQELGGTVMMKISLKLVILPEQVYIRERVKKCCQYQKIYYLWFISEQAIR